MLRLAVLAFLLAGCAMLAPTPAPSSLTSPAACAPTDQDAYVYHPARLIVLEPCIRVMGTVVFMRAEPDGDYHIRLALDPAYTRLVNAVNVARQHGDLVVEPVCERMVTQVDAIAACKADADPLSLAGLKVGTRVWTEGRYVTDTQHGGWAELHPLYRFGLEP